jgi:CDP-diacylglycerol--glycerol-3-phosphate 3-phosphatidyltransferase
MRYLPNGLTLLRILFSPILFYMILVSSSLTDYLFCYYLFVFAGLTDIYDGTLARRQKNITTFGKFVDPIADKFLLAATLIPFYMLSSKLEICRHVTLPILIILLGREVLVTALRYYSMGKGLVFSASRLAKFKTAFQMFFIGSILVQMFHTRMLIEHPGLAYGWFNPFHDLLNAVVISVVVALSIASAVEYLVRNLPLLITPSSA